MKRILALITALAVMLPAAGAASAETERELLVSEVFDNYKTNDIPEIGKHSLTEASRVIEEDGNKVFSLKGTQDNSVSYTFRNPVYELAVDFELEFMSNNAGAEIAVTTMSGQSLKLLSFDIGGSARTWDGYDTHISAIGRRMRIALLINTRLKTYSIYKNKSCMFADWRYSALSQGITGFSVTVSGDGQVYEARLDNIRAYEAEELISDAEFPGVAYNSESIEYKEPDTLEETIGSDVFVNEDFENAEQGGNIVLSGVNPNNKGNPMSIEYDRGRKSGYLLFQGFSSDPHIDISITEPKKHMVFELDVRTDNFTGSGPFLLMRDAAGASFNSLTMNSGTLRFPDGTALVRFEKGVWHNIAVALNFSNKTYDVYLDRELVKAGIVFGNRAIGDLKLARIHISSCGSGGSEYRIDNYKIYEGAAPDFEMTADTATTDKSVFESDDDVRESLADCAALLTDSKIMWANGKKSFLDAAPELIGDITYVPVRAVSEAFGVEVAWNDAAQQVSLADSTVTVNDTNAVIGGKESILPAAPILKDGRCLLPLRTICEQILGKNVYWNDGLIIVGNQEYPYSQDSEMIDKTRDFVMFYRPDAAEIQADFEQNGKNVHPRIMMSQANIDNVKRYLAAGNAKAQEYYDAVLEAAEAALEAPVCEFVLPDNYRLLGTCQTVLVRMRVLGLAWLLTGDERYPERAWLDLKAAGNFATWNYQHHLDVAEMTMAFAVGYDWMYSYWTKSQRQFIIDAMYEKSLSTYYAKFMNQPGPVTFQSWTNGTNWNAVCNGGTIAGALAAAEDYPELCYDLIAKCMRSTECLWKEFGPQGSWPEGPGYLTYALEYIDFMIASMDASLGTDYGLINMGEIGGIGDFYAQTDGYVGANNYQDMAPGHQYVQYLFWLAAARNEKALGQIQTKLTKALSRPLSANESVCCLLWYDPEYEDTSSISFPLDAVFSEAELFCTRTSWSGNDGVYLSAHGGYNNHNHWHIDSGTFVLDAMGERWAMDHGPDNYNAKEGYFSKNRYKFYRLRAEGHNCIVINPNDGTGQEFDSFSPIIRFENSERSSIAAIDLTDAYRTQTESYVRGYMLGDSRRTVTVRDEVKLKEPGELYWFMQTSADVTIESPKKAVLKIGFKKMVMEIESDAPYEFYVDETVPLPTSPAAEGQVLPGKKRVTLKYTGVDAVNVTVKFTPYDYYGITAPINSLPISSWTLEEGAYKEPPRLSMLYADGEEIYGFEPQSTQYRLSAPESLYDVPQITAEAPEGVGYEVEQSSDIGTATKIRAYYLDQPDNAQYYNVGYVLLPELEDLNGKKRYQALSLTASSEPEPDNVKENAFNGIIGDRWAASGKGEWLLIDLGEEKDIGEIGTAFIQGDVRIADYAYMISSDGENFETVFSGSSSGKTTDFEFIPVNKRARYVKFEGYGNTVNSWNSISEIAILAP